MDVVLTAEEVVESLKRSGGFDLLRQELMLSLRAQGLVEKVEQLVFRMMRERMTLEGLQIRRDALPEAVTSSLLVDAVAEVDQMQDISSFTSQYIQNALRSTSFKERVNERVTQAIRGLQAPRQDPVQPVRQPTQHTKSNAAFQPLKPIPAPPNTQKLSDAPQPAPVMDVSITAPLSSEVEPKDVEMEGTKDQEASVSRENSMERECRLSLDLLLQELGSSEDDVSSSSFSSDDGEPLIRADDVFPLSSPSLPTPPPSTRKRVRSQVNKKEPPPKRLRISSDRPRRSTRTKTKQTKPTKNT